MRLAFFQFKQFPLSSFFVYLCTMPKEKLHPVFKARPKKDRVIVRAAARIKKLELKAAAAKNALFVHAIQTAFSVCPSATEVQIDLSSFDGMLSTMVYVIAGDFELNGSNVLEGKRRLNPESGVLDDHEEDDIELPAGMLDALFVLLDAGLEDCDNRDAELFTLFRESGLYVADIEHINMQVSFKRGEPIEL